MRMFVIGKVALLSLLVVPGATLFAQDDHAALIDRDEHATQFTEAIEDNSFFIEEAYNQEDGVIQHISTLMYFNTPQKNLAYTFTEEIPVGGQAHQISFTLPYFWLDGNRENGVGDVLLNYRYQLWSTEHWAAVAPRFSLVLPVGNKDKGLGAGVFGVQVNLPASKRLTNHFIVHANAGATILPNVKAQTLRGFDVKHTLTSYNLGISGIGLLTQKFNVMLEVNANFLSDIDGAGNVLRSTETTVSPGLRAAIDIGDLQIVPGLAVPAIFSEGESQTGFFFYLSFEHPW